MVNDRRRGGSDAEALVARARRFAALGEPARMTIVEHLLLADASPGELGALVDLPSNLLAHHLKVLADAGLTRRVRSEGDRRRSYLQLRLDDPGVAAVTAGLHPPSTPGGTGPARVVFVCTHNSARSQLAAAAWSRLSDVPVTSAGTHPAARVHPRAVRTARRHGLTLDDRTRDLHTVVHPDDLLVAVCDNAYEDLGPRPTATGTPAGAAPAGAHVGGVDLHWSVPDPVRVDDDTAFEAAWTDLTRRVTRLAGHVADRTPDPAQTAGAAHVR